MKSWNVCDEAELVGVSGGRTCYGLGIRWGGELAVCIGYSE